MINRILEGGAYHVVKAKGKHLRKSCAQSLPLLFRTVKS